MMLMVCARVLAVGIWILISLILVVSVGVLVIRIRVGGAIARVLNVCVGILVIRVRVLSVSVRVHHRMLAVPLQRKILPLRVLILEIHLCPTEPKHIKNADTCSNR